MESKSRPEQSRRITIRTPITPALRNAVQLWAEARTDPTSPRRGDLLRDKTRIVRECFTSTDKHPGQVTPLHVATWSAHLEDQGLTAATIYHRLSQLSSWYKWALSDEQLREAVTAGCGLGAQGLCDLILDVWSASREEPYNTTTLRCWWCRLMPDRQINPDREGEPAETLTL